MHRSSVIKLLKSGGMLCLLLLSAGWSTELNLPGTASTGKTDVIYHDSSNYWNMKEGKLVTKKLHSDTVKTVKLHSREATVGSLFSEYSQSNSANFGMIKSGLSGMPGGHGGILTIRFDDGFKYNLTAFAPRMAKYGAKAVVGIVAAVPGHEPDTGTTFMTWSEIRELAQTYDWEIACHSYDHSHGSSDDWHAPNHGDYWESWLNLEKAKKVIEDSVGVHVVSFIAPSGDIGGWDDYFLRRNYWDCMVTQQGYNIPGRMNLYRLKIIQPPVDLDLIADSGYWAIRFFHKGTAQELEEVESLIVRAKRKGIAIMTPREVIQKFGYISVSPIRIAWEFLTDSSFRWNLVGNEPVDFTDSDLAKFEKWANGRPSGWIIEGTYDSVTAETLRSSGLGEANNQTIPTATSIKVWLDVGDSLAMWYYFDVETIRVARLSFYTILATTTSGLNGCYWMLVDTNSGNYWNDTLGQWQEMEIHNHFTGFSSGCQRWSTYVSNIPKTTLKFYLHLKPQFPNQTFIFDDLSFVPSTSGSVKVKVIFDKVPLYRTEINSAIDMIFDNRVGPVLTSPNGTRYRLKVDDSGNLSTEKIP